MGSPEERCAGYFCAEQSLSEGRLIPDRNVGGAFLTTSIFRNQIKINSCWWTEDLSVWFNGRFCKNFLYCHWFWKSLLQILTRTEISFPVLSLLVGTVPTKNDNANVRNANHQRERNSFSSHFSLSGLRTLS